MILCFNKRIFELTACCQIKTQICAVSVGTDGNELWHLNQQLAEGLCPQIHLSIDWVNMGWSARSSTAFCLPRQHTQDSVWLDVWPLAALSVRLLCKCIKQWIFVFFIYYLFIYSSPACQDETDVPVVWVNETRYDINGVQAQSL